MKLNRNATAIGAIALTAGIACTGNASTSSTAALQFGDGAQLASVSHKNCFPIFGVRKIHLSGSSHIMFVRRIVGWRCLPLATMRPRRPIPDPGPYKRPGRIGELVNPQAGR
jgi:hypothetical protein